MNKFEEYLDKLQKDAGFSFRPIRWFASNLQKKFKLDSYQKALEIARSWWNEKGSKALADAKPPEVEIFSELRKDKDGSFYGTIYLVKEKDDPITKEDQTMIMDVVKKYGALRDMPFKEQKYKNGKIVYKTIFTFTKDKNQGVWINRFKHNIVDEIRKYSDKYVVSSRIPGWLYETDLQENNMKKTDKDICECGDCEPQTEYTLDDALDAFEAFDMKKAYEILLALKYSEEECREITNMFNSYDDYYADRDEDEDGKMVGEATIIPADAIVEYASENQAWEEVVHEFIDQSDVATIESVCDSLGISYGAKDAVDIKTADESKKSVIKEDEGDGAPTPEVPGSTDQLIAKIVEIRGKIDSVAKSVANIQAYCANHTDQREINDLTVDLNSGVQDAIEALEDIVLAAGDQKKDDKKAAADAIDQIA